MSGDKARRVIENYIKAFNAHDLPAMLDSLNFPFSWILNNMVISVPEASEFVSPSDMLAEQEGWHHSELDLVEPVQVWDTKAHFKVTYSRFRADGIKYSTEEALWIVTTDEGHWCRFSR